MSRQGRHIVPKVPYRLPSSPPLLESTRGRDETTLCRLLSRPCWEPGRPFQMPTGSGLDRQHHPSRSSLVRRGKLMCRDGLGAPFIQHTSAFPACRRIRVAPRYSRARQRGSQTVNRAQETACNADIRLGGSSSTGLTIFWGQSESLTGPLRRENSMGAFRSRQALLQAGVWLLERYTTSPWMPLSLRCDLQ